ncbi:MAG: hypothetical protein K2V38_13595 [Gemmataceae bacterium]|nr:hypothetical protein [Gemmataceae bacterium]
MTHDLFGKLRFKDADESWACAAPLPRFAAVGQMPDPPPLTEAEAERMAADMNAALEAIKAQMAERFGEKVGRAFAELERETDETEPSGVDPTDPKAEARAQRRRERREKNAALLARGLFPVRVAAPGGAPPSPSQEAAFKFLKENEQAVFDAVGEQVWGSFQEEFGQEAWRKLTGTKPASSLADLAKRFAVNRLDIAREARNGFAHLTFLIEADWQDDHGLLVVYSPDTRLAQWTSWDGLFDLLESDEPEVEPEEYVPTPHDLLLEAILTGDEARAKELVAAGADINALGADEYPPLWVAVDQLEAEEVRRLLAFGADPTLANPDERTTPLKHARRMYRDLGFGPSKKRDELADGVLSMMREAAGDKFHEVQIRLEAIIQMLEAAGPKG